MVQSVIKRLKSVARVILPPEVLSRRYFKRRLGYPLNLKNPQSFNEKLQWLKLYYFPNSPLAIQCTDKFEVRKYVEEIGLGQCLNTLLGVWDHPEEIVWSDLPEQFALKCTHGCEFNILCQSKSSLDIVKTIGQLRVWLRTKYEYVYAEPHYHRIKPRIVCERYLGENIVNYKFFCFHGEPLFMYVVQGSGKEKKMTCFDRDRRELPYKQHFQPVPDAERYLDKFDDMIKISRCLSHPFPFVRVDLYKIDGQILLGEMTFTPTAGYERFCPKQHDQELGRFLRLEYPSKTPGLLHFSQL